MHGCEWGGGGVGMWVGGVGGEAAHINQPPGDQQPQNTAVVHWQTKPQQRTPTNHARTSNPSNPSVPPELTATHHILLGLLLGLGLGLSHQQPQRTPTMRAQQPKPHCHNEKVLTTSSLAFSLAWALSSATSLCSV